MKRFSVVPAVAISLLLFFCSVAHAEGKLDTVGRFVAGDAEMRVLTYTDGPQKVGLIGVAKQVRVSVAFSPDEWSSLMDLWKKARQVQSRSWQLVGSFKETGTKEETLLTISAGPGVQFTVVDPSGTVSFVLEKSDYNKFDSYIREVSDYLTK